MIPIDACRAGGCEIPILYMDNHVLAVVKPANMPVQKDDSGDLDLLTALKGYVGEKCAKPGNVFLGLVHRLDRPVGGVMVFARTSKAAARLSEAFAGHTITKKYVAVLRGTLDKAREMDDYLYKGADGFARVVGSDYPGAKRARLLSAPLARADGLTLAEVTLYTGRAHQIRVQHAHAGLPLWGDARYGGGKPGEQIALWARELVVPHPTLKTEMRFVCPPPDTRVWRLFREALS